MTRWQRVCAAAAAALTLAALGPAGGSNTGPSQVALRHDGRIRLPILDPKIPMEIYVTTGSNMSGLVGWVYPLPGWADGRPYELTTKDGATDRENVDVLYYESIKSTTQDPFGRLCPWTRNQSDPKHETGIVCPGPLKGNFAVVFMTVGAEADFSLYIPEPKP